MKATLYKLRIATVAMLLMLLCFGTASAQMSVRINHPGQGPFVSFPAAEFTRAWVRNSDGSPGGFIRDSVTTFPGSWLECYNDINQSTLGPSDSILLFLGTPPAGAPGLTPNLIPLHIQDGIIDYVNTANGAQVSMQARREAFCRHDNINTGYLGDPNKPHKVILGGRDQTEFFDTSKLLQARNEVYTGFLKPGAVCREDGNGEGLYFRANNWPSSSNSYLGSSLVRIRGDKVVTKGDTTTIDAPVICSWSGGGAGDTFRVGFGDGAFLTTTKVGIGADGTAWQTGGTGGLPIQGYVRIAPTGAQTRWRYVVNGGLESNASGGYVPVELFNTIELLNVTDGCPQVDLQSVYKVAVYDYGQRPCTPGPWGIAYQGKDITVHLDGDRPITLKREEVSEVMLNLRAPLQASRCTTEQKRPFIGQNTWLVSLNGGCYAIGGGFDIIRPVISINPIITTN